MNTRSGFAVCVACSMLGLSACGDDQVSPSVTNDGAVRQLDAAMDSAVPTPAADGAVSFDAGSEQPITLRFQAKLGSEDMICGQTYEAEGQSKVAITPQDFRLFVQAVRLITASGTEVPVKFAERFPYQSEGIALLDFTDGSGACTSGGPGTNMVITGSVPAGNYTGIVFVNGVPDALNHGDPTMAPAPLQAPGASWGWLFGYRFLMAEVRSVGVHDGGDVSLLDASVTADGGVPPHPSGLGLMHLGSTACSGTEATGIRCDKPNRSEVRLHGFDPASSIIVADLGAVFAAVDLRTDVQCHGSGPPCAPMFEALGVDLDSGASLATQRVYHLE